MYIRLLELLFSVIFFTAIFALVIANLYTCFSKYTMRFYLKKFALWLLTKGATIAFNGFVALYGLKLRVTICILLFKDSILRLQRRYLPIKSRYILFKCNQLLSKDSVKRNTCQQIKDYTHDVPLSLK